MKRARLPACVPDLPRSGGGGGGAPGVPPAGHSSPVLCVPVVHKNVRNPSKPGPCFSFPRFLLSGIGRLPFLVRLPSLFLQLV